MMLIKMTMHMIITHIAKMSPISSQIAAKIKSLSTNGMSPGVPCVSPSPKSPPPEIAKSDCVI